MFRAVFTWGETYESENQSWRKFSRMVKWTLQNATDGQFEMCRVYTKSGQCVKVFTNF